MSCDVVNKEGDRMKDRVSVPDEHEGSLHENSPRLDGERSDVDATFTYLIRVIASTAPVRCWRPGIRKVVINGF